MWLFVVIVVVLRILVTFMGLLCQFLVIDGRLCGVLGCGVDLLHLVLLLIGFVYLVAFEWFVNWC